MSAARVKPVMDYLVRSLCTNPYPNHPRGCPNWSKRSSCPPAAHLFDDVFDLSEVFAIWTTFPFGEHVHRMKTAHPDWTERQLSCCLYWQGTARKLHKIELAKFLKEHPGLKATSCPEAMGVNVTATLNAIGENLEWPPKTKTYQVSLAAKLKRNP